ncbi:DUF6745 domain-containing protein [Streptomyces sp. MK37H]|nr:hypothetical protein [Streptomyces sp. MK37H]
MTLGRLPLHALKSGRVFGVAAPPRVRTAREGVAWTFGVDADTYRPEAR